MPASAVEIAAPDISTYARGEAEIPYVTSLESGRRGPHAVITALVHGNELCGAWALITLLERGIRPSRGRLSLAFVNVEAYARFDPTDPKAMRYMDEDLNRLWEPARLESGRRSRELARARQLRPLIESADFLLDVHSMQVPSPPLLLCGLAEKGLRLGRAMGYPGYLIADAGHRNGARMRDFGAFADPASPRAAVLVECGQHWAKSSVDAAIAACRQFLAALDLVEAAALDTLEPPPAPQPQRVIEVTDAVTVDDAAFRFVRDFQGLEVIPEAGTVIAHDGGRPIRTPHDHCVLVMPSQRLSRGLTAVRLGRFVE
jgi:predicted deacylase